MVTINPANQADTVSSNKSSEVAGNFLCQLCYLSLKWDIPAMLLTISEHQSLPESRLGRSSS